LESNTASVVKGQNERAVFGDVPCDPSQTQGTIHLVGIGGIGMSAIARLLLAQGKTVSGSDRQASEITQSLANMGATIYLGHAESNVYSAAALVVSSAITPDNPELTWALNHNLPIWHRSRVLAALSKGQKLIAISGTHGKTTTTGMIAQMLIDCGLNPAVVIGGVFSKIGSNSQAGGGEYFVAESDESDGTHASLQSHIAVVTNVEADHLENYPGGIKQIQQTMADFANHAAFATVLCQDDAGCQALMPLLKNQILTYGRKSMQSTAKYQFESLPGFGIAAYQNNRNLGEFEISVPGEHNKLNAMASVAVGMELGLNFEDIARSLKQFHGVDRRFQIIGSEKNILVIDDYAHHPTEVVATLEAAKEFIEKHKGDNGGPKRLVAVFQPHQPGRLRDFWQEFCHAFTLADLVLIGDVYVARGSQIEGINSKKLVEAIKHPNCHYLGGTTKNLAATIKEYLKANDLVITIGAGDITTVGPQLISLLKQG
jgi:UDP-N-acetylmuramate--alanine ligase